MTTDELKRLESKLVSAFEEIGDDTYGAGLCEAYAHIEDVIRALRSELERRETQTKRQEKKREQRREDVRLRTERHEKLYGPPITIARAFHDSLTGRVKFREPT